MDSNITVTTEFDMLAAIAKDEDPVHVYATGATISVAEKRWIKQYYGNDYFSSYSTKFSRPVRVSDSKGLSSVNKQLSLLASLATAVNRRGQVRDGIKPEVGVDITTSFALVENKIIEGVVLPEDQIESVKAQLRVLRSNYLPTEPSKTATKKVTRKKATNSSVNKTTQQPMTEVE